MSLNNKYLCFKNEESFDLEKEEGELLTLINEIGEPNFEYENRAREYNDTLCKPLGSLGKMEKTFIRLNGIFNGELKGFKKGIVVFSSDNGIFEEGISSNPQDTTYKVCINILNNGSGLCKISKFYNVDVFLEDLGVLQDVKGHINYKINYGTKSFKNGPAMSRLEAVLGLKAGFNKAKSLIDDGYNLIGFGEMGVGNTTTSSAIIAKLTNHIADETTGFGSGLTDDGLLNKIKVINEGIKFNEPYLDTIDVLRKLGGLDICAMAGAYLACSYYKIPFVLDGVISMAAYLVANKLNDKVRYYAFTSHKSQEKGARIVEEHLKLDPPLSMDMRLGEGSGCPIAMNLIELSVFTICNMATFNDVAVNKNDYVDIRKGDF